MRCTRTINATCPRKSSLAAFESEISRSRARHTMTGRHHAAAHPKTSTSMSSDTARKIAPLGMLQVGTAMSKFRPVFINFIVYSMGGASTTGYAQRVYNDLQGGPDWEFRPPESVPASEKLIRTPDPSLIFTLCVTEASFVVIICCHHEASCVAAHSRAQLDSRLSPFSPRSAQHMLLVA